MNNETLMVWLAIAAVVSLVVVLVILALWVVRAIGRARRGGRAPTAPSHALRSSPAPSPDRPPAAATIEPRDGRVPGYRLRALTDARRERYSEDWRAVQGRFAEQPAVAVADAELLIQEVMHERGFPVDDFEERKADVSAYYPQVVESYRQARLVAERNRSAQATTEELRQVLKHYRALFGTLLADRPDEHDPV